MGRPVTEEQVTADSMPEAALKDLEAAEPYGDALETNDTLQTIEAANGNPASGHLDPREPTGQADGNPNAQRGDGTSGA